MVTIPGVLTPHTVIIRDKTGDGAYGPIFDAPRTVTRCRVEDQTRLVRDTDGHEVVSSTRLFLRPEHGPIPVGSLVTVWPASPMQRDATVIAVAYQHTPPAPTHFDVALT